MDLYREGKNIYYNIGVVNKDENPKEFRYFDKRATNSVSFGYKYKLAVEKIQLIIQKFQLCIFHQLNFLHLV